MRESSGNEMVGWECGCPDFSSIRQGLKDLDFTSKLPDHARRTSFHSHPSFSCTLLLLTKGI